MKKKHAKRALAVLLAATMAVPGSIPSMASTGTVDEQAWEGSRVVAKQIEAEGIVLLKNDNQALPLEQEAKVNVFGTSSLDPFLGGGGSGAISVDNEDHLIDFYEGLAGAGISYNQELYDIYDVWYEANKTDESFAGEGGAFGQFGSRPTHAEMPISELSEEQLSKMKAYSDTAVIVIGRCGTESADLTETILKLSQIESDMVAKVADTFSKVVVLFNIDNVMEMGFLEEYPSIQAAAVIWAPGEVGMESVGKMLSGQVNPSGRLADTIAYHISDHPSSQNFGRYSYENNQGNFVEYEEGVYVGYRYFETFEGAKELVQYPFGYGLSYTDFAWEVEEITADETQVKAQVKVTNTGDMAGKDVVQVYFSAPYTGKIEKSAIELAGYAKTGELAPGQSEGVSVAFDTDDMASYDVTRGGWVMEEGDYEIKVNRDVRTTESSYVYRLDEEKVIKEDDATGSAIENRFEDADYGLTLLSREDAAGTYPTAPEAENNSAPVDFGNYEKIVIEETDQEAPITGAVYEDGVVTLQDVYEAGADDLWNSPLWDTFLDQFTVDEMIELSYKGGFRTAGVERLGVPATVDNDGPAAIKGPGGSNYEDSGIAYPVATVLACTFNDDLAEAMGQAVGDEAAAIGTQVWYAPGMNIHRSPRGGRNFEYYSEDPMLSGKMAAGVTRGAQSKGLIVTLKHFAVNDQEQGRERLYTWAGEQALREIYLEPFEIAVKEGNALGIMSSFNRIGATWAGGNKSLLTDLLRGEWGYQGFVVSDYTQNWSGTMEGYFGHAIAIYAGNDTILSPDFMDNWLYPGVLTRLNDCYDNDPVGFGTALRKLTKNLCYMKMHTLAFDAPVQEEVTAAGTYTMYVEGFDWGPGVTKIILSLDKTVDADSVSPEKFQAAVEKEGYFGNTSRGTRNITGAYTSDEEGNRVEGASSYITLEMSVHPDDGTSNPFFYNFMVGFNVWANPYTNTITLTDGSSLQAGDETITALDIDITAAGKIRPIAEEFVSSSFTSHDITLTYASYAPAEDGKKNPLIIWLHGAGEGGTDTDVTLLGNPVLNLAKSEIQDIFDGAYVLTPQAPTMWMDNGTGAYTQDGTSMYTETLMDLIRNYVDGNKDIDTNRIYLGGCSNGGFMTMNMILHYPEYFAAAYPICEAYTDAWISDEMLEQIKDLPIWFTHAANDPTVNPQTHTVATVERLREMGAPNLHFSYFEDVHDTSGNYEGYQYNGHWSWLYTLNNQCEEDGVTIMEWMAEQTKEDITADLTIWINFMEGLDAEEYTAKSWSALQSAIDAAKAVKADKGATRAQIDRAVYDLVIAFGGLEYGVQKQHLQTAVDAAQAILDRAVNYEEESLAALKAVIEDAKVVLADRGATQDEVNQMAADVIDAIVQVVTDTDVASLEGLIAAVEEIDGSKYTPDSVAAVDAAAEAAREVLDNPNRGENDLFLAYKQLADAIRGLELKGNKAALISVIERARDILANSSKYTPSTIEGLGEVLEEAEAVYNDENANQAQVNAATEVLTRELAKVRLKGDVDGNGKIDTSDTWILLKHNAELAHLSDEQLEGADVNGDGLVDTKDVVLILQYASEEIEAF